MPNPNFWVPPFRSRATAAIPGINIFTIREVCFILFNKGGFSILVFGGSMAGRTALPKEVADWLLKKNSEFKKVYFVIYRRVFLKPELSRQNEIGERYSRLYRLDVRYHGVLTVSFPYKKEIWHIRIVGGFGPDGNLCFDLEQAKRELPPQYRERIAGISNLAEKIAPGLLGEPRRNDDGKLGDPVSMVEVRPDIRNVTSEPFDLGDIAALCESNDIAARVVAAMRDKNWAALEALIVENRCA